MNEFDSVEQLLRDAPRPAVPSSLRANVLHAINIERQLDSERSATRPVTRVWYQSLDRVAIFAAPCLLVFSLFTFGWVHWSTGRMLSRHRAEAIGVSRRFVDQDYSKSPRLFFAYHVNLLEKLQIELFHETSQEAPEVDRHRPPLGRIRRNSFVRIS